MPFVALWMVAASAASAASASSACQASLAEAHAALRAFDAERAELLFREVETNCPSRDTASELAGLLYDQSLDAPDSKRTRLLREAHALVRKAFSRGETTGELCTLRAAIEGDLAQISDSSSEQASLLLSVHKLATEARRLDPEGAMPLVVLGAWHRNAQALGFGERLYIRMVAGPVPDASLGESRRLLDLAVEREVSPVTLYFLAATREAQGDAKGARATFTKCIQTSPKSLRDVFIRGWCEKRTAGN